MAKGRGLGQDARRTDQAVRLYLAGMTLGEAARRAGLSRHRLRRALRQRGVPRRAGAWEPTPAQAAKIVRLYGQGLSIRGVAARLGLSEFLVGEFLRDSGVPMLPRGRRPPVPTSTAARVVRLYTVAKVPVREIARHTGLSAERARRVLQERGVAVRNGRPPWEPTPDELREAARLYAEEGWGLVLLGARFGVSGPMVARRLRGEGIALRGPGRQGGSG
jgi:DNA-binding transcriptional regulator LsrR (DeoR family)